MTTPSTQQRPQDGRAVLLAHDGPAGALELAHRGVGVQAHDQAVAQRARRLQRPDVSGVQEVEATARGDDDLSGRARRAPPRDRIVGRRRGRRRRGRLVGADRARASGGHEGRRRGHRREHRLGRRGAVGQRAGRARGEAVAGAARVASVGGLDPDRQRRPRAVDEHDPARAARHADGGGLPAPPQGPGAASDDRDGVTGEAGLERLGLGRVGGHQRGAGNRRRAARVRIPDDGVGGTGQRVAQVGRGRHAATVVGDEQRGAPADGRARLGVRGPDGAAASAVEPQQRAPGRADAQLLGRRALEAEVDHLYAARVEHRGQLGARGVAGQRGHQGDRAPVAGRQQGRQPGAAGSRAHRALVEHRHRRVGTEALDRPEDVAVEQRVADDDDRAQRAHA